MSNVFIVIVVEDVFPTDVLIILLIYVYASHGMVILILIANISIPLV